MSVDRGDTLSIQGAILIAAGLLIAAMMFIDRWQISAIGFGYAESGGGYSTDTEAVYRLDRWIGEIDRCYAGPKRFQTNEQIACSPLSKP
jgi:hypothetical protein